MKTKIHLIITALWLVAQTGYAQCGIEITGKETVFCGDSVKLNASPVWQKIEKEQIASALSFYFTTQQIGYSGGGDGKVYKTTDGGVTWLDKSVAPGYFITSIYFTDMNTGYFVGINSNTSIGAKIFKTTDAGNNWVEMYADAAASLRSMIFINATTAFVYGGKGAILKTSDAGVTWVAKTTGTTAGVNKIQFFDANTAYASIDGGILKTVDAGETWAAKPGVSKTQLSDTYFTDQNTGYGVIADSIYKTVDGGASWSRTKVNVGGWNLFRVAFSDANTGYVLGVNFIFTTTDAGKTWISHSEPGVYGSNVQFMDSKTVYCLGSYGYYKLKIPDTISWSPSTGLSAANIADPMAAPKVKTTYIVTATTGTCVAKDTITIDVTSFTANAGVDKDLVCGGTAQLDAVTTNYTGTGALTYSWSPADGLSATNISAPSVKIKKTTTYYVTVTNPGGCTATDSVTVLVNPLMIDAGVDQTIICGGKTKFYSPLINYTGNEKLSYVWSPANSLDSDTIISPTSNANKKTVYHVTLTTANGCVATDSLTIFVNPLVANAGNDKMNMCGDTVLLDGVTSNYTGTAPLTYSWLPTTGLHNATVSNPLTGAHDLTYTVTITTSNGCKASDQVRVDLKAMDAPEICMVGVDSTNKNVIRWNDLLWDAIDSVFIYRETTVAGNYVKIGSTAYSKNGFRDLTSQPEVKSNKYKISLLDTCGLESPRSVQHKTMHLAITKGIGTSWNLIWEPYEGFTVPTYNIYRGTDVNNLQLIDATSGTSTQFTNYNPPPGDLFYQVEVVNPSPCDASNVAKALRSNVAASKYVGIFEQQKNSFVFSVYPNPANNLLTVNLENVNNQNLSLTIYNAIGAVVKTMDIQQNQQQIDVSNLSNGLYMIELKSTNGYAVQKLAIDK